MDADDWFTLEELTDRLGALAWVEQQLADLLERWAAVEADDAAVVYFATTAQHHRWHAEVITQCLPTSPRLGAADAIVAPTPGWTTTIDSLHELDDPEATTSRLRSLAKVLDPWLEREIEALAGLARPVSDAAMLRWLRFVAIDHHDDGAVVDELLRARVGDAIRLGEHQLVNELDLT